MISLILFGLVLSSCKTLTPFRTAHNTYNNTFDSWVRSSYGVKDDEVISRYYADFIKASEHLINVAKQYKPNASEVLRNAINAALVRFRMRYKKNSDNFDIKFKAEASIYKDKLIDNRDYLSTLKTYYEALETYQNSGTVLNHNAYKQAVRKLLRVAGKTIPSVKMYGEYHPDIDIVIDDIILYYDSYLRNYFIYLIEIYHNNIRDNCTAFKTDIHNAVKVFKAAKSDKQELSKQNEM